MEKNYFPPVVVNFPQWGNLLQMTSTIVAKFVEMWMTRAVIRSISNSVRILSFKLETAIVKLLGMFRG